MKSIVLIALMTVSVFATAKPTAEDKVKNDRKPNQQVTGNFGKEFKFNLDSIREKCNKLKSAEFQSKRLCQLEESATQFQDEAECLGEFKIACMKAFVVD